MAEPHRDEIDKLAALYAANPEGRVFTHLAEAHRKAGELDRARKILEDGLARHAEYSSAHVVLGRILVDQGDDAGAAAAFRRVLELDPQNLVALRTLGDLCVRSGDPGGALGYYDELLHRDRGDEELQETVAGLRAQVARSTAPAPASPDEPAASPDETAASPDEPAGASGTGTLIFEESRDATAGLLSLPDFDAPSTLGGDGASFADDLGGDLLAGGEPVEAAEDRAGSKADPGADIFAAGDLTPGAADPDSADFGHAAPGFDADSADFGMEHLGTATDDADLDMGAMGAGLEMDAAGSSSGLELTPAEPASDDAADADFSLNWPTEEPAHELPGDLGFYSAAPEPGDVPDQEEVPGGEEVVGADAEDDIAEVVAADADAEDDIAEVVAADADAADPLEREEEPFQGDSAEEEISSELTARVADEPPPEPDAGEGWPFPLDESAPEEEEVAWPFQGAAEAAAEDEAAGETMTETMADLYLRQGFPDRAAEIFRALLRRNPGDARLERRLADAEAALDAPPVRAPGHLPADPSAHSPAHPPADSPAEDRAGEAGIVDAPPSMEDVFFSRGEDEQPAADAPPPAGVEDSLPARGDDAGDTSEPWMERVESAWTGGEGAGEDAPPSPYAPAHEGTEHGAGPTVGEYFGGLLAWSPPEEEAGGEPPEETEGSEPPPAAGGEPQEAVRSESPEEAAPGEPQAAERGEALEETPSEAQQTVMGSEVPVGPVADSSVEAPAREDSDPWSVDAGGGDSWDAPAAGGEDPWDAPASAGEEFLLDDVVEEAPTAEAMDAGEPFPFDDPAGVTEPPAAPAAESDPWAAPSAPSGPPAAPAAPAAASDPWAAPPAHAVRGRGFADAGPGGDVAAAFSEWYDAGSDGGAGTAPAREEEDATSPSRPPEPDEPSDDEDLDMFRSWLQSLKK